MKYVRENKDLLFKYLFIIISNVLIYVFSNFYFKNSDYKEIIMLLVAFGVDLIIYYYNGNKKFIYYLDYLCNFIVGFILMFIIKDIMSYSFVLFSLFFANNFIFLRSRLSDKFFRKTLQYILMSFNIILSMFINMCIYNIIF